MVDMGICYLLTTINLFNFAWWVRWCFTNFSCSYKCSLWQYFSFGTLIFYLLTLNMLQFNLFFFNFNIGHIFWIVSDRDFKCVFLVTRLFYWYLNFWPPDLEVWLTFSKLINGKYNGFVISHNHFLCNMKCYKSFDVVTLVLMDLFFVCVWILWHGYQWNLPFSGRHLCFTNTSCLGIEETSWRGGGLYIHMSDDCVMY
jgi:hypothetical protein